MAAPPTFVAKYDSNPVRSGTSTGTPATQSVTTAVGDALVLYADVGDPGATSFSTPTGGTGLTWTLQQQFDTASFCVVKVWTAVATTAETFTLSVARTGTANPWGWTALRFSDTAGVGATNIANGNAAPSLTLTTQQANSAIVVTSPDWDLVAGANTWRTPSGSTAAVEQTDVTLASSYRAYGAYHADAGAAGSKVVGMTAPTGQAYVTVAVEVLPASAKAPPPVPSIRRHIPLLVR